MAHTVSYSHRHRTETNWTEWQAHPQSLNWVSMLHFSPQNSYHYNTPLKIADISVINPLCHWIVPRPHNGTRMVFHTDSVWMAQPYIREWIYTELISHPIHHNHLKCIEECSVRPETKKSLGGNVKGNLRTFLLVRLHGSRKGRDKRGCAKQGSFLQSDKRCSANTWKIWGNQFQLRFEDELISNLYEELLWLNKSKSSKMSKFKNRQIVHMDIPPKGMERGGWGGQ